MLRTISRVIVLAVMTLPVGLLSGCHGGGKQTLNASSLNLKNASAPDAALGATDWTGSMGENLTDQISVLSFNMQHRDRPNELTAIAAHFQNELPEVPDFILLQEVRFKRSSAGEIENSTAAALARQLGHHVQGTKRTSDREGVAIVSRYPFVHYEALHMKTQTSRLLLGFRRVSVMGEFLVPDVGRVRVVNVHFTNWGFERRVRRKQLKETLEWMAQRQAEVPADVIFLGGDFNAQPDGDELDLLDDQTLTGGLQFHNFNDINALTKGSRRGNVKKRIDYIFVATPSYKPELIDEEILWRQGLAHHGSNRRFYPSDHLPVLHAYALQPVSDSLTTPSLNTGTGISRSKTSPTASPLSLD